MWGEDTVKLSDKGRHTQGHVVGVDAAMSLQPRWILFSWGPAKPLLTDCLDASTI